MNAASFHNILTIVISLVFLAVSLGLIAFAIRQALDNNSQIERRLSAGIDDSDTGSIRRPKPLEFLAQHLTLPGPEDITRLRFQLAQAGYFDTNAVSFSTVREYLEGLRGEKIVLEVKV